MSIHSQNRAGHPREFGAAQTGVLTSSSTPPGDAWVRGGCRPACGPACEPLVAGGWRGGAAASSGRQHLPAPPLSIKRLASQDAPVVSRWRRGPAQSRRRPRLPDPEQPQRRLRYQRRGHSRRIDQFLGPGGSRGSNGRRHSRLIAPAAQAQARRSRSISCLKRMSGWRFDAGRKRWLQWRSGRSSRPRRARSGEEHRVFSVAPWRGEILPAT